MFRAGLLLLYIVLSCFLTLAFVFSLACLLGLSLVLFACLPRYIVIVFFAYYRVTLFTGFSVFILAFTMFYCLQSLAYLFLLVTCVCYVKLLACFSFGRFPGLFACLLLCLFFLDYAHLQALSLGAVRVMQP